MPNNVALDYILSYVLFNVRAWLLRKISSAPIVVLVFFVSHSTLCSVGYAADAQSCVQPHTVVKMGTLLVVLGKSMENF